MREFKQNGSRRLDRVRNPVVEYQYTERKLVVNVRNTAVQGSIQQLLAGMQYRSRAQGRQRVSRMPID